MFKKHEVRVELRPAAGVADFQQRNDSWEGRASLWPRLSVLVGNTDERIGRRQKKHSDQLASQLNEISPFLLYGDPAAASSAVGSCGVHCV